MRRKFTYLAASLLVLALTSICSTNLQAQAHNWIGGNGDFDVVWNWDIGVPGANDVARFDLASTVTIQLNATQNIRSLQKLGSTVKLTGGNALRTQAASDVLQGQLLLTTAGTQFHNETTFNVGGDSGLPAQLFVEQGALVDTVTTNVARLVTQTGHVDVRGVGSRLDNSGTLTIGDDGDGSLNVENGGTIASDTSYIGLGATSNSSALITGGNSRWDTANDFVIGYEGDASLDIEDGGIVTSGQSFIGRRAGSSGVVTLSGDQTEWSVDRLFLGTADGLNIGGAGTLNINFSSGAKTGVWVGDHRSPNFLGNFLSVSDSGANGRVYIIRSSVNAGALYLGEGLDNVGEIYISGAGSQLALEQSLNFGALDGCGKLIVNGGGSFSAANNGRLMNGTVVLSDDGSQLEFGNLYLGSSNGSDDAGVAVMASDALVGTGEAAVVYVGDDHSFNATDSSVLVVSDSGARGNLVVRNGSSLATDHTHVGFANGTSGEATVSGNDSQLTTRWNTVIGHAGDGTLNILDGGRFNGSAITLGNLAGSVGEVNVVGVDSILNNIGPLHIGDNGTATLTIDQGGIVQALNTISINSSSNVNIGTGEFGSTATDSIANDGTIGFSGVGVVRGPMTLGPSGQIRVEPNAQATFMDSVEHNGFGFETQANGKTTFVGGYRGSGDLFGAGDVFFESTIEPGVGIGSIEFHNNIVLEDSATMMIELGGTAGNQFDSVEIDGDCDIAGDLQVDFVNGHGLSNADRYLILTIAGNSSGQFAGLPEGTVVGNSNGYLLRISYLGGDGNDVELYVNSIPVEIVPDVMTVTRGNHVAGVAADLGTSDNNDVSIQRSITDVQSRTEFIVQAISPHANPTTFELKLEGAVFARSQVVQTIEFFNYQTNDWELIGSQDATRLTDSTVTASPTGDRSRFVDQSGNIIEARIRYRSTNPRQRFASNTDQVLWTIGE